MTRIDISMTKLIGAIVLGASFFGFSQAQADSGDGYVYSSAPKPWVVISNGQSYTKFSHNGNVTVVGRLKYDTQVGGKVKSWWGYPSLVNGYGIAAPVQGTDVYKISKSYSVGNRPKKIDKNLPFSIPASKVGPIAISMCNSLANSLRSQGKSNKQIFGQNREVSFKASLNYHVNASGSGSNNPIWQAYSPYVIPIRCAKWSGAQVPTAGSLTTAFKVIKATMKHQMIVTLGGTCKVKLTTAISTNKANENVKFRYKSQSGKQSNIFTVKTAANKIAVVTHTWNITNTPSVYDGTWIHMDGVAPKFKSNTVAAYTECKEGGPDDLAPNPKKPKVGVPLGGDNKVTN